MNRHRTDFRALGIALVLGVLVWPVLFVSLVILTLY